MPADDPEQQRLDRQHRLFKDLLNGRILLAPVNLKEGDAVLETGTGTGAWLVDLASSVDPSVQMVGVDIEPRLFPVEAPKNISFHMNTVLNLPAEWTNKFTLVHQRLLMVALRTAEWPQALSEMHRVLRPGGWVQIAESSTWPVDAYPGRPSMEKLVALMRALLEERDIFVDCGRNMPTLLKDAGFVDVQQELPIQKLGKWAGESGVAMKENVVNVFGGLKTPILRAGGYGIVASEAEYDALVQKVDLEWDSVPGTVLQYYVCWARKL
uniref:S-adenosyl-L-methionine-dependent methyltransferase n=1 Tax=Mycena chlorophos TaxID=658473 RepID=A0ABQ0LP11_MYCCL|nr:S-adenosyl-L-methionine-dependent methyltransferase [Mycena chlorophos]